MNIEEYIGDGVYCKYDGYGMWLHCMRDGMPQDVYLEPNVMKELDRFYKECASKQEAEEQQEEENEE